jgi:hypothetical protein
VCGSLAVLAAAQASAEDLVSPSYRLRGLHVATTGPAWLTSTAPSPTISASGVSVGQSEAIGYGLPVSGLEASWAGFWPLVVGTFPNHDLDADGVPSLTDPDDDGDGLPDTTEIATDPLDPDSDDDELCDGAPWVLPACALGGEDFDGDGGYDPGVETDPNNPDTDGDGWSDGVEVRLNSNPLNSASHPHPPSVPALQAAGLWLLAGVLGLIGITRLRKWSRS